ncbi:ubiquitin thiolesterase, putative peptidase C19 [Pseudoloma neurophilia]|uniref:Ubiquitin thiolesterase, putative peptidase C19 n=1 Tax=Pseudoloma neurophilia TaxID=146866 RepID=A0A0R0M0N8_9MICR|nr:ubiquitin thiolesterase, putative peptidase C19 [Pseudoloma neurophilia]
MNALLIVTIIIKEFINCAYGVPCEYKNQQTYEKVSTNGDTLRNENQETYEKVSTKRVTLRNENQEMGDKASIKRVTLKKENQETHEKNGDTLRNENQEMGGKASTNGGTLKKENQEIDVKASTKRVTFRNENQEIDDVTDEKTDPPFSYQSQNDNTSDMESKEKHKSEDEEDFEWIPQSILDKIQERRENNFIKLSNSHVPEITRFFNYGNNNYLNCAFAFVFVSEHFKMWFREIDNGYIHEVTHAVHKVLVGRFVTHRQEETFSMLTERIIKLKNKPQILRDLYQFILDDFRLIKKWPPETTDKADYTIYEENDAGSFLFLFLETMRKLYLKDSDPFIYFPTVFQLKTIEKCTNCGSIALVSEEEAHFLKLTECKKTIQEQIEEKMIRPRRKDKNLYENCQFNCPFVHRKILTALIQLPKTMIFKIETQREKKTRKDKTIKPLDVEQKMVISNCVYELKSFILHFSNSRHFVTAQYFDGKWYLLEDDTLYKIKDIELLLKFNKHVKYLMYEKWEK